VEFSEAVFGFGLGDLIVGNGSASDLIKLDETLKFQFGGLGSGDGQLDQARGVAINNIGDIHIVDGFNHRVQIFNPNGNY
jgi:tripartite motif-containing protein 71